jgi:hypothetical protein
MKPAIMALSMEIRAAILGSMELRKSRNNIIPITVLTIDAIQLE